MRCCREILKEVILKKYYYKKILLNCFICFFNKFSEYYVMGILRQKQTMSALRKHSVGENDRNSKQTNTN